MGCVSTGLGDRDSGAGTECCGEETERTAGTGFCGGEETGERSHGVFDVLVFD